MKAPNESSNGIPVVLIHLGPSLPPHFWQCLRQTRRFHSGRIFCVLPRADVGSRSLEEASAVGIANEGWERVERIRHLRSVSWLDRYGLAGFWHYTLERLFVLAEVMRQEGLREVLHLENDVTIYLDPMVLAPTLRACFGAACAIAPLGPTEGCTAAVLYVGSTEALDAVCDRILELLPLGERNLCARLPSRMVHEMMLLGIIQRERPDLLRSFPVTPSPPRWPAYVPRCGRRGTGRFLRALDRIAPRTAVGFPPHGLSAGLEQFESLFDAGPLGQFVGGTARGDAPGIAFRHHWIGRDLLDGRFAIQWEQDREGRRVPQVLDRYDGGRLWKLNNLHVHSKRLGDFV